MSCCSWACSGPRTVLNFSVTGLRLGASGCLARSVCMTLVPSREKSNVQCGSTESTTAASPFIRSARSPGLVSTACSECHWVSNSTTAGSRRIRFTTSGCSTSRLSSTVTCHTVMVTSVSVASVLVNDQSGRVSFEGSTRTHSSGPWATAEVKESRIWRRRPPFFPENPSRKYFN